MSIFTSYTILPDLKLMVANFQGKVTMNDIIHLLSKIMTDTSYNKTHDVLIDFRDSIAIGYKMDIADFFEFFKKNISLEKRVLNGILYNTPNQKFLLSVYIPAAKIMKINANNFREIDDCLNWMGYCENDQIRIKESLNSIKGHPKL